MTIDIAYVYMLQKRHFPAIGDWRRYIKEEHKNVFYEDRSIQRTGQNECYFILIHYVVSNSAIRIVLQITNCILVCIHILHKVIINYILWII